MPSPAEMRGVGAGLLLPPPPPSPLLPGQWPRLRMATDTHKWVQIVVTILASHPKDAAKRSVNIPELYGLLRMIASNDVIQSRI